MKQTHHLKTLQEYFQAVIDGRKLFEIRNNDRGFEVGDRVILEEYLGIKRVPACPHLYGCNLIRTFGLCSLLNKGRREACFDYTEDKYSGRTCLIQIKEIFKLDKIGIENFIAFTFDILNIRDKKATTGQKFVNPLFTKARKGEDLRQLVREKYAASYEAFLLWTLDWSDIDGVLNYLNGFSLRSPTQQPQVKEIIDFIKENRE